MSKTLKCGTLCTIFLNGHTEMPYYPAQAFHRDHFKPRTRRCGVSSLLRSVAKPNGPTAGLAFVLLFTAMQPSALPVGCACPKRACMRGAAYLPGTNGPS